MPTLPPNATVPKRPHLPPHLQHAHSRPSLGNPPLPPNLLAPSHSSASLHSPRFQSKDTFRYPLTDDTLKDMRVAKTFKDNTGRINALHYSTDGRFMVTSSDDDSILVYDCGKGIKVQTVNSKKYGACHVQFLHARSEPSYSVIHASSKIDNTLRFLKTDNKQYIRYFSGHTRRVTGISAAATEETFLSCGADNTVRLWDLKNASATATLQLDRIPVAAYDRDAICFAVAAGNVVKLFDVRNFTHGPFFSTKLPTHYEFSHIQFSPNNKQILISGYGSELYVVDAFSGELAHTLKGMRNNNKTPLIFRPTYAPGSQYIFCGSIDGHVCAWAADSGDLLRRFPAEHPNPVENVGFHPKYFTLATACKEMRWWMPAHEDFNLEKNFKKESFTMLQPPPAPPIVKKERLSMDKERMSIDKDKTEESHPILKKVKEEKIEIPSEKPNKEKEKIQIPKETKKEKSVEKMVVEKEKTPVDREKHQKEAPEKEKIERSTGDKEKQPVEKQISPFPLVDKEKQTEKEKNLEKMDKLTVEKEKKEKHGKEKSPIEKVKPTGSKQKPNLLGEKEKHGEKAEKSTMDKQKSPFPREKPEKLIKDKSDKQKNPFERDRLTIEKPPKEKSPTERQQKSPYPLLTEKEKSVEKEKDKPSGGSLLLPGLQPLSNLGSYPEKRDLTMKDLHIKDFHQKSPREAGGVPSSSFHDPLSSIFKGMDKQLSSSGSATSSSISPAIKETLKREVSKETEEKREKSKEKEHRDREKERDPRDAREREREHREKREHERERHPDRERDHHHSRDGRERDREKDEKRRDQRSQEKERKREHRT